MARIKIEEIIEHLGYEIRRALQTTMERVYPNNECNQHELFREFKLAIRRECNIWMSVPDHYIEKDED